MVKEDMFNRDLERAELSALLRAEAVLSLLCDGLLRERLVQSGLHHTSQLFWDRVRGELFLAYQMALDGETLAIARKVR